MNAQAIEQGGIRGSPEIATSTSRFRAEAKQRLPEERLTTQTYEGRGAEVTEEELAETLAGLNSLMENMDRNLHFTYHEGADRIMVEVIDMATSEVVKTFPPEELLDLAARIGEMVGMFLDQRS
jgi:flagellar protein FlaG